MRPLYEINQDIENCIDSETGEVIDFEKLEALTMEREEKFENVALWVKDLIAEAAMIKAEKLALGERQKAVEHKAESLRKWLTDALAGQKFKTARCEVAFRRTKAVEITNLLSLPTEYLRVKDPEPDKAAIKKAIEAGEIIEGAELVENVSCSIK